MSRLESFNTIEGYNRQLRKVTKNKGVFPTDDSLIKMLYLSMIDKPTEKFDYIQRISIKQATTQFTIDSNSLI